MKTKHEKIVEILIELQDKLQACDESPEAAEEIALTATAIAHLYSAGEEQLEPEGERPTIKEYFGDNVTLDRVHETYIEQPELFQYAQALDRYIDNIESSPQQLSEGEIEEEYNNLQSTVLQYNYIKELQSYIEFLRPELDELATIASAYGWKSSRHNEGVKRRAKLAAIKELLNR